MVAYVAHMPGTKMPADGISRGPQTVGPALPPEPPWWPSDHPTTPAIGAAVWHADDRATAHAMERTIGAITDFADVAHAARVATWAVPPGDAPPLWSYDEGVLLRDSRTGEPTTLEAAPPPPPRPEPLPAEEPWLEVDGPASRCARRTRAGAGT